MVNQRYVKRNEINAIICDVMSYSHLITNRTTITLPLAVHFTVPLVITLSMCIFYSYVEMV